MECSNFGAEEVFDEGCEVRDGCGGAGMFDGDVSGMVGDLEAEAGVLERLFGGFDDLGVMGLGAFEVKLNVEGFPCQDGEGVSGDVAWCSIAMFLERCGDLIEEGVVLVFWAHGNLLFYYMDGGICEYP